LQEKRLNRLLLSAALVCGLVCMPVAAVDYIRLSPSEFAEDLVKASEFAAQGRYEEAIELLKVLVADEPDDADALSLMGYSLRKSGQTVHAEGFYLRALAIEPAHLGANQYLGELYVETGNIEGARHRLEVLDGACGDNCEGRDLLAAAIAAAPAS
jgi:tetratricopeptide (TPR) repeat protein